MGTCNFLMRAPAVASLCAEARGSLLAGEAMWLIANRVSVEKAKPWR